MSADKDESAWKALLLGTVGQYCLNFACDLIPQKFAFTVNKGLTRRGGDETTCATLWPQGGLAVLCVCDAKGNAFFALDRGEQQVLYKAVPEYDFGRVLPAMSAVGGVLYKASDGRVRVGFLEVLQNDVVSAGSAESGELKLMQGSGFERHRKLYDLLQVFNLQEQERLKGMSQEDARREHNKFRFLHNISYGPSEQDLREHVPFGIHWCGPLPLLQSHDKCERLRPRFKSARLVCLGEEAGDECASVVLPVRT